MADRYVRSTDGSNADNGTTWALAKATGAGVTAIDAAGDRLFFSQVHSESTAGTVTLAVAGTDSVPSQVLCGNDAAQPPTALATGAIIQTTGAFNVLMSGDFYCYGMEFRCGSGASGAAIVPCALNHDTQTYESCVFNTTTTNSASGLAPAALVFSTTCTFLNCTYKFGATTQGIFASGCIRIVGGSLLSGGSSPATFIKSFPDANTLSAASVIVENFDMTNFASTVVLTTTPPAISSPVIFRNCKLPASWSGTLIGGAWSDMGRVEMYNCDSGSTNYKLWIEDSLGVIRDESTFVRIGGASDGANTLSWKMVSAAKAAYPLQPLQSPEIFFWNNTTGSARTVTIPILRDSATNLKDNEVWLEVSYLGSSATPLGTLITDRTADVLTTAADQASSVFTWTTTGMTNPNKQELSVTFTPQKIGLFICRVMVAKPSTTLYVDYEPVIS